MHKIIHVLLITISLSFASMAYAKPTDNGQNMSVLSKTQAAQLAKQRYGGKVLKIQLVEGASPSYKVKLLSADGTVQVVTIAAKP